jgi:hypothetical protein
MKAISATLISRDMLKCNMFGVKSPGGVEPIVRLLERAMKKDLPVEYKFVTSLDFKNAFNTMPRRLIAEGLRLHGKGLYRCARWAYEDSSQLFVSGASDDSDPLNSSHGVRQGDPLGPFLWSLAYPPILDRLEKFLGEEECLIVSYLDDTYILSRSQDPLPKVVEFYSRPENCLQLNQSKCKTVSSGDVRVNGFEVLGTVIGPEPVRGLSSSVKSSQN